MVFSIWFVAIWIVAQTLSRCAILDPWARSRKRHTKSCIQQAVRPIGILVAPANRVPTKNIFPTPWSGVVTALLKA
jgi:hypothetical protein